MAIVYKRSSHLRVIFGSLSLFTLISLVCITAPIINAFVLGGNYEESDPQMVANKIVLDLIIGTSFMLGGIILLIIYFFLTRGRRAGPK